MNDRAQTAGGDGGSGTENWRLVGHRELVAIGRA